MLTAPGGAVLTGDVEGTYWLPATGTYAIQVYGYPGSAISGDVSIAQSTSMPFTIALRCSAPPATPTPAQTPSTRA